MQNDPEASNYSFYRATALWIVGSALSLQLLTFCGGTTVGTPDHRSDASGGSSARPDGGARAGSSASAGAGFGGHTAGCLGGCGGPCGPCAGYGGGGWSGGGFGGHTSGCTTGCFGPFGECVQCNTGGYAGVGGGLGGHTAGCIGTCGGPCGPCAGYGGFAGYSGFPDSGIIDAHTPLDVIYDAPLVDGSLMTLGAQPLARHACYTLSGYEPDPCLPADDSLLPWLSDIPGGCEAHITGGPFAGNNRQQRTCCYSVACDGPGAGTQGASR